MVTHDWTPPATVPGKWSARPSYDCTKGSVSGQLSPDLRTLVFDLTVLPAVHSYDLVIVPGADVNVVALPPAPLPQLPAPVPPVPDPTQAAGSPTFDVTFEPVTPSDLSVFPTSPAQAAAPAAILPADTSVGPAPLASLDVPAAPAAVSPVPAAATPAAVVPIAIRKLAGPVAKVAGTSRTSRVIAAVVFCALAAWAWSLLASDSATGIGVVDGRPALSLHDAVPLGTEAGLRRRFTTSGRTGTPPALR
jgi:hypothetical protein